MKKKTIIITKIMFIKYKASLGTKISIISRLKNEALLTYYWMLSPYVDDDLKDCNGGTTNDRKDNKKLWVYHFNTPTQKFKLYNLTEAALLDIIVKRIAKFNKLLHLMV